MPFVITEDTAVTLPFNPCHFLLKDIVIKPQKKKKKKEIFSDQDLSPNHEKEYSTFMLLYSHYEDKSISSSKKYVVFKNHNF